MSAINALRENNEDDGIDLLSQMDIEDITALRAHFFICSDQDQQYSGGLSLTRPEFINAMDSVAGNSFFSLCAGKLFDALDIDGSGTLQWEEVLDAIIEKMPTRKKHNRDVGTLKSLTVQCLDNSHKNETIVKLIYLETDTTFCFALVSKSGIVGIYDGSFTPLGKYNIALKPTNGKYDGLENGIDEGMKLSHGRRSHTTWITDAIFVPNTYSLLFASSDRSLHHYDATGLVHVPLCQIIGLPNKPMCLTFHGSCKGTPRLLIGDDKGDIIVMMFHQSQNSLFKKKHPDKLDKFYWNELSYQTDYVTYKIIRNVHNKPVKKIIYNGENDTIVSCSLDAKRTLVVQHIEGRRETYIFKFYMGITCFRQDLQLHIIVTGSNDNIVRIWNSVVTNKPTAELSGHKGSIVDARIIRCKGIILSLDGLGEMRMWDIHQEFCIQNIVIQYTKLGSSFQFGTQSIYPGVPLVQENRNYSVDCGSNYLKSIVSDSADNELSTVGIETNYEDKCWESDQIIAVCCGQVAVLTLSSDEYKVTHTNTKPPPVNDNLLETIPLRKGDLQSKARSPDGSVKSISTSESYLVGGNMYKTDKGLHSKKTQYYIKQEQMKMLIQQNAPHLALDVHELETIVFSNPLPDTKAMREKGIDVSTPQQLLKARIQRNSAGKLSTLECQSVKSSYKSGSKIHVAQKPAINPLSAERSTPEWFSSKVNTENFWQMHK